MKIIPKDTLPDFPLPLPIFSSIHIADAISREGEEFDVFVGMEKKYVDQLKKLSGDKSDIDLQNFTGDLKRFVEESYENWYKKNRTPFILVHKQTDALAALIWFGPKPLGIRSVRFSIEENKEKEHEVQNEWHTISFRSYPLFRGKGMMENFSRYAMDEYKKHFSNSIFWSGTDDRNTVFTNFIPQLGFEIDDKNSDLPAHWLVMVKK